MIVYNNNNNNNSNDEHSNKIYNSVFNNNYIRKIIFNHLNKYNILSININFNTIGEWKQFQYKQYLYKITLGFNLKLNELPENIKHVSIPLSATKNNNSKYQFSVPSHIESVCFSESIEINKLGSLSSSIKAVSSKLLKLHLTNKNSRNLSHKLPQSITDLKIEDYDYSLSKDVLPRGLKKLSISKLKSFEDGCFPESLTDVEIIDATPLIVNQFSITGALFSGLVKLDYCSEFCQHPIGDDIQFPNTIQELSITCFTFNARLPDKLKSFNLVIAELNYEIQFPSTLEYLYVFVRDKLNKPVFKNQQSAPANLKKLHYHQSCSSIIDSNGNSVLPNKLESLLIWEEFNQELKSNHLPSSLTYLELRNPFNQPLPPLPSSLTYLKLGRSFNQPIDIDVLPSNLKTLIIDNGNYSQDINPLAIPQQLKHLSIGILKIDFSNFRTLSRTHPNTELVIDDSTRFFSEFYDPSNTQMRALRLPSWFDEHHLSTLQLQDKSNLEYLHLKGSSKVIQLSELPTQNNIKTLVLGYRSSITINLEHFQNLETIIIPSGQFITPTIISSKDQNGCLNTFKLKNIYANPHNSQFLFQLDINFYQFLRYSSKLDQN